jgi:hypothetical protein
MLVGACGMFDLLARRGTSVASTGRTVRIGRTANTMYPAEWKFDARRWGSFGTSAAEVVCAIARCPVGFRSRFEVFVSRAARCLLVSQCVRTIRRIRPSRPVAQGHDWP